VTASRKGRAGNLAGGRKKRDSLGGGTRLIQNLHQKREGIS